MTKAPTLIYGDVYIFTGACQKCGVEGVSCVWAIPFSVCLQCIATAAYRHEDGRQQFQDSLQALADGVYNG